MRVLWITNTIFPALCEFLDLPEPVTGGWMYGLSRKIGNLTNTQLAVATLYNEKELKKISIDGILYYLIPSRKSNTSYNKEIELHWIKICNEFNPDIIHIHGTEFSHGLACMRVCPDKQFVISIQGLVSICSRYYYSGIKLTEIIKNITLRDLIRIDTIFHSKKNFEKRGLIEREYLQRTHHVIGRTSWDFAHCKAINPKIRYHFCNESLREGFYQAEKWNCSKKNNYSVFLSQASYPIKGLHQVLKAISLLKEDFPGIMIRVAGTNVTKNKSYIEKIKISGYGRYIRQLISKFQLENKIQFLGSLTEVEIIKEYQRAHVFICPSSIENSPNSLGEAQILGTPCIASYVGGIPDMVTHEETGLLYRFEEVEMLATQIRQIFTNEKLINNLSINEIVAARKRHDPKINFNRTVEIYHQVISPSE